MAAEMRMIRQICGYKRLDMIKNEVIRDRESKGCTYI